VHFFFCFPFAFVLLSQNNHNDDEQAMHKAMAKIGREARMSKLMGGDKDAEHLRAPNGEHAFISTPCYYAVGKKSVKATCFVTKRYAIFAPALSKDSSTSSSSSATSSMIKIRLRLLKPEGGGAASMQDAKVMRASGLEFHVNGSTFSVAFKSDKERDEIRKWITSLSLQDDSTLLSSDQAPLSVSSESSSSATNSTSAGKTDAAASAQQLSSSSRSGSGRLSSSVATAPSSKRASESQQAAPRAVSFSCAENNAAGVGGGDASEPQKKEATAKAPPSAAAAANGAAVNATSGENGGGDGLAQEPQLPSEAVAGVNDGKKKKSSSFVANGGVGDVERSSRSLPPSSSSSSAGTAAVDGLEVMKKRSAAASASAAGGDGEVVVHAAGVSVLTLALGVAVFVVASVTYGVVSSHRMHVSELQAKITSQVRSSSSMGASSSSSAGGRSSTSHSAAFSSPAAGRREKEAAVIRASLESLRRTRSRSHKQDGGGAREFSSSSSSSSTSFASSSENAATSKQAASSLSSAPSSRGTRDMRSEMKERFTGKFQTEPQYDIVFKMDLSDEDAAAFHSRRTKQKRGGTSRPSQSSSASIDLTPRSPIDAAAAAAAAELMDRESGAGEDADARSGVPLEDGGVGGSRSGRSGASDFLAAAALCGAAAPAVSAEDMQNVMRGALVVLAEQYVRDRLGDEVFSAMRLKKWAVYDPRVLALLESKPGDAIREHVFEMLAAYDDVHIDGVENPDEMAVESSVGENNNIGDHALRESAARKTRSLEAMAVS